MAEDPWLQPGSIHSSRGLLSAQTFFKESSPLHQNVIFYTNGYPWNFFSPLCCLALCQGIMACFRQISLVFRSDKQTATVTDSTFIKTGYFLSVLAGLKTPWLWILTQPADKLLCYDRCKTLQMQTFQKGKWLFNTSPNALSQWDIKHLSKKIMEGKKGVYKAAENRCSPE